MVMFPLCFINPSRAIKFSNFVQSSSVIETFTTAFQTL